MKRLLKDIVIPRGTVFSDAPTSTYRCGVGHIDAVIGLTDNSSGTVNYYFDEDDFELSDWFEDIKGDQDGK